jgi:hypothetical protein
MLYIILDLLDYRIVNQTMFPPVVQFLCSAVGSDPVEVGLEQPPIILDTAIDGLVVVLFALPYA